MLAKQRPLVCARLRVGSTVGEVLLSALLRAQTQMNHVLVKATRNINPPPRHWATTTLCPHAGQAETVTVCMCACVCAFVCWHSCWRSVAGSSLARTNANEDFFTLAHSHPRTATSRVRQLQIRIWTTRTSDGVASGGSRGAGMP
jgi:hypothetical protein